MKFHIAALVLVISLCFSISFALQLPTATDDDARIIGTPSGAFPGQFPFIASVHRTSSAPSFLCAGVIISVTWILTSANCVSSYSPTIDDVKVKVGGVEHDGIEPGRDEIYVNNIHLHEDYNPGSSISNNIALLHLERNIIFNNLMQPASLANPSKPVDMTKAAVVLGWGGSSPAAPVSILQYDFTFRMTTLINCEIALGVATSKAICTDGASPNPTTCYGDVGGPLLQFDDTFGTVLYGITSYSMCKENLPTIYESIVDHRMWIYTVSGV